MGPGCNIAELFFFSGGGGSEDTGEVNDSSTNEGSITGSAKSLPTALTADRVEVSGLSDCAIETASGSISFGSTMSELCTMLVDKCWAAWVMEGRDQ